MTGILDPFDPFDGAVPDYDSIKAVAKALGRAADSLYVLSAQNDPFYIAPASQRDAEWFAELWERFDIQRGAHLRRIHYRLISQATQVRMPDGKAYVNTFQCWQDLCQASAYARHLGLVPVDALVDRRNNEPLIYLPESDASGADAAIDTFDEDPELGMPALPSLGLSPPTIGQRYHIEIWAEKTTMNDILGPLAERFGCNSPEQHLWKLHPSRAASYMQGSANTFLT
jgi:hypothetical protein